MMSYNILAGGFGTGRPLSWTVDVIEAAEADVIGIQEGGALDPMIATALGFNIQRFSGGTTILSRYPITEVISNKGVKIQISPTQQAYVFDDHLDPYPYQPYDFRDGVITTEAEAIAAAQTLRGPDTTTLLNSMSAALTSGDPVFLTGDFNEPSHLDWTQEAADAGLNFSKKVAWPTSTAVTNAGLTDAFREIRPDEIGDRGETWTPGYPPPNFPTANEVHDRIDFVYYAGANVAPVEALLLGYEPNDGNTDIVVQPYPSDHRALVVEFDFPGCGQAGDVNSDCAINTADWMQFRNGQHSDMTGFTAAQAYAQGDLNGDFSNNHADFVLFKSSYESAFGAGSFSRLLSVPEPASAALAMWIGLAGVWPRRLLVRGARRSAACRLA
ncbi:MAG: endonuclease/exonuclease/phosphatase family protein [Pirellulales bacterium]